MLIDKELALAIHAAFEGFSNAVFGDGALSEKVKQLIDEHADSEGDKKP